MPKLFKLTLTLKGKISVVRKVKFSIWVAFMFSFVILLCFLLQHMDGMIDMHTFAIVPGDWHQFYGIFTTILVHNDFQHFIFNIVPLFALMSLLIFFYTNISAWVVLFIVFFGGLGVFFVGAPGYHIGASGLIFGLITFMIFSGFIRQNRALLTVSFMVLVFYGGSLFGVLPLSPEVSWEGHLFGSLAGIIAAFIWRKKGPNKDMHLFHIKRKSQEDDEYARFSS
ncbi:MAG: rhomboid family intramembrane serine protease [Bacteroidia bacterium]|nr:rhomboid family intramembrane serine protease [Bacteroidia bacterium]